ncbi:hypothetical protein AAC387_Pa11g0643 [Persea americana]
MPARYKGAPRPSHPWSQATVLVRMGRHLPPENTARPDRYEQSFMAIGSLIYGDKRCALSPLYANWLKAWKEREGCCPFHLLLPVRIVPFSSSSSCLVFSELTQASECLRLTAARASDPSLSPSFSGSWSSAFPVRRSLPRSYLNLSRCRFYRLQFGAVCGKLNKKLVNTMPPKTRNGEGPSKGKALSMQPTLAQNLPPTPPQQRRSGGRSPTVQTQSRSRGVTMLSLRDVPPPEQPHHSLKRPVQGDKSVTKPHEKSARAGSQSHHQVSLDRNEDPAWMTSEPRTASSRTSMSLSNGSNNSSKTRRIRARRPGA